MSIVTFVTNHYIYYISLFDIRNWSEREFFLTIIATGSGIYVKKLKNIKISKMKSLKIASVIFLMTFTLVSCDKITMCKDGVTISVNQWEVQKYEALGYTLGECSSNEIDYFSLSEFLNAPIEELH